MGPRDICMFQLSAQLRCSHVPATLRLHSANIALQASWPELLGTGKQPRSRTVACLPSLPRPTLTTLPSLNTRPPSPEKSRATRARQGQKSRARIAQGRREG